MPLPMLVRPATEADLAEVGAVTVAAYAPFLLGEGDEYRSRLGDAATRYREAELWVATDEPDDGGSAPGAEGRTVLGSVTLCPPGSPWREVARDGEMEFRMLAVAPEVQGRGVGDALVRLCLDDARRRGARAVVLCSLREMAAAHRLYRRLGFERLPERDWRPLPDVHLIAFRHLLEDR